MENEAVRIFYEVKEKKKLSLISPQKALSQISNPSTYGIFETWRVRGGKIEFFDLHMERLYNSLIELTGENPSSFIKSLSCLLNELLENDCRFYQKLYKGRACLYINRTSPWIFGLFMEEMGESHQIPSLYLSTKYGIRNSNTPFIHLKTLNRTFLERYYEMGLRRGFKESIIINERGHVCEGTRTNIFFYNEKYGLVTPSEDEGILPGVMRKVVIKVASELGMDVHERAVSINEIKNFHVCFITNSLILLCLPSFISFKKISFETEAGVKNKILENLLKNT